MQNVLNLSMTPKLLIAVAERAEYREFCKTGVLPDTQFPINSSVALWSEGRIHGLWHCSHKKLERTASFSFVYPKPLQRLLSGIQVPSKLHRLLDWHKEGEEKLYLNWNLGESGVTLQAISTGLPQLINQYSLGNNAEAQAILTELKTASSFISKNGEVNLDLLMELGKLTYNFFIPPELRPCFDKRRRIIYFSEAIQINPALFHDGKEFLNPKHTLIEYAGFSQNTKRNINSIFLWHDGSDDISMKNEFTRLKDLFIKYKIPLITKTGKITAAELATQLEANSVFHFIGHGKAHCGIPGFEVEGGRFDAVQLKRLSRTPKLISLSCCQIIDSAMSNLFFQKGTQGLFSFTKEIPVQELDSIMPMFYWHLLCNQEDFAHASRSVARRLRRSHLPWYLVKFSGDGGGKLQELE